MNQKQRIAIIVGLAVIVLMCLFPPWKGTTGRQRWGYYEKNRGYALVFMPPKAMTKSDHFTKIKIDIVRLLVQCTVACVATGGAYIFLGKTKEV